MAGLVLLAVHGHVGEEVVPRQEMLATVNTMLESSQQQLPGDLESELRGLSEDEGRSPVRSAVECARELFLL
jgi:hypothetical protein